MTWLVAALLASQGYSCAIIEFDEVVIAANFVGGCLP